MGGFVIDIFLVYLFRILLSTWRRVGASSWEMLTATVAEASCPMMPLGCPVAEIVYLYVVTGETYSGIASIPFIWQSSAELYAKLHCTGTPIQIRVDPTEPKEPFVPKVRARK